MNKKYMKVAVICFLLLTFTGCTTYLKDENNKIIKNSETGQNLPKNILCLPTDKTTIATYDEYNKTADADKKVDLAELVQCEKLSVVEGKYEGIWTTIFVKPLAWFIINIGKFINSYGLALIIATLLIRGAVWPMTKKTALQSEKMKQARPEIEQLEKKYKGKTTNEFMMQKSQETMLIYKKYGISPMSGCLFSFIQIPLFFAFYEAISRIPVIFEETFLGFQLGTSPLTAVIAGKYYYLIFIVLIVAATYFSFKLNSSMSISAEQEKQMKSMTNIMVVFMTIASFSISSGIAIYWITSNVFTIVQNLLVRRSKKNDKNN